MRIKELLIAVLIFACSCSMFEKPEPGILDFLPRETDVPGWELMKKPERIYGKQMRKTVVFAKYHAIEKSQVSYKSFSESEIVIRVEIYRFNSVIDAYGMFSRERGLSGLSRNITEDYFTTDEGAFFMKGNYCIRVLANNKEDLLKKYCDVFISNIRRNLQNFTPETNLPPYLALFSGDFISQNVLYYRNGYNSLPGFKKVFIREREISEDNKLIFFVRFNTSEKAQKKFQSVLNNSANDYILTMRKTFPLAFRKLNDDILLFFSVKDKWIFGILNSKTQEEGVSITDMLRGEIRDY